VTVTRADLGQKVYEVMSLIFTRFTAPTAKAPLDQVVDSQKRYDEAVLALQELSGFRAGTPPSISSEDSSRRISALNMLTKDIKGMLTPLMKGKPYVIGIRSEPVKMRNSVTYKEYDILATVTAENKTFMFAINDQGQYILSDKMYWTAV
jgi:hypothetical protein